MSALTLAPNRTRTPEEGPSLRVLTSRQADYHQTVLEAIEAMEPAASLGPDLKMLWAFYSN